MSTNLPASLVVTRVGRDHPDGMAQFCRLFDSPGARAGHAHHCHCFALHHKGSFDEWDARTPEQNRDAKLALFREGQTSGLVASVDGEPVGWCHAARRATLGYHQASGIASDDGDTVGAIVCLLVLPDWQRKGVARAMVSAACDMLRDAGMTVAEAYPIREPEPDYDMMDGTVPLFEQAGFRRHRELETRVVMRRTLA